MTMFWTKLGSFFRRDEVQSLSAALNSFFVLHPEFQVKSVLGLTFCFFRKIHGDSFESSHSRNDLWILSKEFLPADGQSDNVWRELQNLSWEQEELWQYFLSFPRDVRMDLLDLLETLQLQYDKELDCVFEESILRYAAEKLDLSDFFEDWLHQRKSRLENARYTAKSAAGLIVALIVLLIFILMAAYLKEVFFGFLFAYLFLPLAKWYRKHLFDTAAYRRFSRVAGGIFRPLYQLKNILWKQAGFVDKRSSLARKAAAKQEALANQAAGVTVFTFLAGICLVITIVLCILIPYVMNAGKSLNIWAQEKNIVNRWEITLDQALQKIGL